MSPSFQAFCSEVVKELCSHQPVVATLAGVHDFDGRLDDLSPSGLASQERSLRARLRQLATFTGKLTPALELDRQVLEGRLSGLLHTVTSLRPWAWNPDYWNETCGEGVSSLIARRAAEPSVRLAACIQRLGQVPEVLELARTQLDNPPAPLVAVAEEQARGSVRFYEQDVPRAFPSVRSRPARRALQEASAGAARAARGWAGFLAKLKRRPGGRIGVGERNLALKLACDELLPERPGELAAIARAELSRVRAHCEELSGLVLGGRKRGGAAKAIESLAADRPRADSLLAEIRAQVRDLAAFCRQSGLVAIPPGARCDVERMPSFLTAMTIAAMDVPGPFDPDSSGAQYLVTLPEASWSEPDRQAALRFFNRSQATWVTAHESFPGHLVQMSSLRACASPVRRFFGPDTFLEGWAHYAEGLVFEAGYRAGDPKALLSKEHGALLRAARCVAALELHAGEMTLPQAERFLRDEGLFAPSLARSEALRCAVDFSCPAYTLGRLGLEKLRAEARAAWGARFSVRRFHDAVLAEGQLPLPLLRQAVLGGGQRGAGRR
ncbi:MAG: DUF885 domain-containing protein [Myxococcaceae bacterium]